MSGPLESFHYPSSETILLLSTYFYYWDVSLTAPSPPSSRRWVGEAERQLRLLFEEALKHQPSIIFFDEIDGLAPVRSSKQVR